MQIYASNLCIDTKSVTETYGIFTYWFSSMRNPQICGNYKSSILKNSSLVIKRAQVLKFWSFSYSIGQEKNSKKKIKKKGKWGYAAEGQMRFKMHHTQATTFHLFPWKMKITVPNQQIQSSLISAIHHLLQVHLSL